MRILELKDQSYDEICNVLDKVKSQCFDTILVDLQNVTYQTFYRLLNELYLLDINIIFDVSNNNNDLFRSLKEKRKSFKRVTELIETFGVFNIYGIIIPKGTFNKKQLKNIEKLTSKYNINIFNGNEFVNIMNNYIDDEDDIIAYLCDHEDSKHKEETYKTRLYDLYSLLTYNYEKTAFSPFTYIDSEYTLKRDTTFLDDENIKSANKQLGGIKK